MVKVYSDVLNEFFDTIEEAKQAEYEEEALKEKEDIAVKEQSNEKKALAKVIEDCEENVLKAEAEFDVAKTKVEELYADAKKRADEILKETRAKTYDILSEAKKNVQKANEEKYNAVCEFNKKFGAYTKQYTGKKAADELLRHLKFFSDIFDF